MATGQNLKAHSSQQCDSVIGQEFLKAQSLNLGCRTIYIQVISQKHNLLGPTPDLLKQTLPGVGLELLPRKQTFWVIFKHTEVSNHQRLLSFYSWMDPRACNYRHSSINPCC